MSKLWTDEDQRLAERAMRRDEWLARRDPRGWRVCEACGEMRSFCSVCGLCRVCCDDVAAMRFE